MINQKTVRQNTNKKLIRLGIWGLPTSGKTVYMTMLYHYLSLNNSQWRIVTDDEDTERYVNKMLSQIMDKGQFPLPDAVREEVKIYSYKLIDDKHNNTIELDFLDCSGELYLNLLERVIRQGDKQLPLIEYLNQCHGILFLLSSLKEDEQTFKDEVWFHILLY